MTHLQDLLRLAFLEPVAWLSAEANSPLPVHWVTCSIEEAQPGDLIVLPVEEFNLTLMAEVQARALGAVLLLGQPAPLPEPLDSGIPIALVPTEAGTRSVQRSLLTHLLNQQVTLMERGLRLHAQLSRLAAEGEGLEGLARFMADTSGRGIIIQDKRLNTLTEQPPVACEETWGDLLKLVGSMGSLPEQLRDRKRAGGQAVIIEQEISAGLSRLVTPITVGGMARGYLSLVGPATKLDEQDHQLVEQGAQVCAVEMARAKAVREAEKRLRGDLLNALLQEYLPPRDATLWAQTMDVDLTQAYVAMRFAWEGPSSPSRKRLETLVNGEVIRRDVKVFTSPMGNEVICFCQVPPVATRPGLALAFGQAVFEQGALEYPSASFRCGVGTPALDLSEWRASFRQAGQALEMARRLRETKPLYFPDLSIYRLLFQIEHNPELITFQEEILGPLLATEGGRELIHTLEAYFEHNGNLSQTAESLFIHRNTLVYRMDRIAEITKLDLDKPEIRLAMQLALHINRMRGTA